MIWYRNYTIFQFEYDPAKSEANRQKHGIDFEAAQELWRDPDLLVAEAIHPVEDRWMGTGRLTGQLWSAIFAIRDGRIRLISVRRARKREASHMAQTKVDTIRGHDGREITTEEFDRLFDEGSDEIDNWIDWDNARRLNREPRRVNVDFPAWIVARLDAEARHRGVTRQALIKMWLADRLEARSG